MGRLLAPAQVPQRVTQSETASTARAQEPKMT